MAANVTLLNPNDIYTSVGSAVVQADPRTGEVTPIVTGLSNAHGLVFQPSSPGSSDLAALLQSFSDDLLKAFPGIASSSGQTARSSDSSAYSSVPSAASILGLVGVDASHAYAGLLPAVNT